MSIATLAVPVPETGLAPDECSAAALRPARLPSEFQPLIAWLSASPGRECRLFVVRGVWWAELFQGHACVASVGHTDPAAALSRALG